MGRQEDKKAYIYLYLYVTGQKPFYDGYLYGYLLKCCTHKLARLRSAQLKQCSQLFRVLDRTESTVDIALN